MSVKYDFSGKRVLVTGGAGGLGAAIVKKFLAANATVFALDNNLSSLEKLKKANPTVNIIHVDLTNWKESRKAVDAVAPIHHLVNNAGILTSTLYQDVTEEMIDKTFGVNFKAAWNMGQSMSEGLKRHNIHGGSIVNVSSAADTFVMPGVGIYACSKAAISMLTKVMAVELGPQGIRVNAICPTYMETDILPKGTPEVEEQFKIVVQQCLQRQIVKKPLPVEDTADVVLYLSTEQGEFVTGSRVLVDGGFLTS